MPDIKWSILVSVKGVESLFEGLSKLGGNFKTLSGRVHEAGASLYEAGKRLTEVGERATVTSMLMSEGAERLNQWSEAIREPAFAMQKSMSTVAAVTGLAGEALEGVKQHAIEFSNTHPGETAEQWADSFGRMRGVIQDTNQAMAATDVAGMLGRFGVNSDAAANLFSAGAASWNVGAKQLGDEFFAMKQGFGIQTDAADRYATSLGKLAGVAKGTNTPLAETMAILGEANKIVPGGRGAMMFESMFNNLVNAANKGKLAGVDFNHGMLSGFRQLEAQLKNMSGGEQMSFLKSIGISDPGQMINYLGHLDEIAAAQQKIAGSGGDLVKGYAAATDNAAAKQALLSQNVQNFYDAIASPALPFFTSAMGGLTSIVQGATSAMEKHSTVGKVAVIGMSVVGTGVGALASSMQGLGAMTMFGGSALQFFGWSAESFKFSSLIGGIASATTATWGFTAALLANPFTWVAVSSPDSRSALMSCTSIGITYRNNSIRRGAGSRASSTKVSLG